MKNENYNESQLENMLKNMSQGKEPVKFTFNGQLSENNIEQEQNRTKKGSNIMLFRKVIPFAAAFAFVIAAAVVGTHFLKKDVPVTPVDPSATAVTSVTDKQEETGKKGSNGIWEYTEYAEAITLTRYLAAAPGDTVEELVIPDEINNKPVTDMDEEIFEYFNNHNIKFDKLDINSHFIEENGIVFNKDKTTIITTKCDYTLPGNYSIPSGVKKICAGAFACRSDFKSITFPDSVSYIGASAFDNCDNLKDINIHNNLQYLGYGAFGYTAFYRNQSNWKNGVLYLNTTDNVTKYLLEIKDNYSGDFTIDKDTIKISEGIFHPIGEGELALIKINNIFVDENNKNFSSVDGVLFNKAKTTLIYYPLGKNEPKYTPPKTVTSIGKMAFYDCSNLTDIIIPNNVTSIGSDAFTGCTNLKNITIGSAVKTIGDNAFCNCINLENINIPDSVTSIGNDVFYNCTNLKSITTSENNQNYSSKDGVLFNKNKTELICFPQSKAVDVYSIPNSITSIKQYAFLFCENLKNINIPNSVTSIGDCAFDCCTNLESVTIGNGVKAIGTDAFLNCTNLKSVTLGNSVKVIGKRAFNNCESLTDITIPNSVTSIGSDAFTGCTNLSNVTIGNGVISIGDSAFYSCTNLKEITIPNSVTSIGKMAFYLCENITIKSTSGSYAEKYAKENNIHFIAQ